MHHYVPFKNKILPLFLILPQALVLTVFFLYPAVQALLQSLYMDDAFGMSRQFVGLENFVYLFQNPEYIRTIIRSTLFSFIISGASLIVALALSWYLVQTKKGQMTYFLLLIIPYAIPSAISGVLWLFLFNPSIGLIPNVLRPAGILWNHTLNQGQASLLVILAAVWKQTPYAVLFLVMALRSIAASQIEAAAIDGASGFRRFFLIILPNIGPTVFYVTTMSMVFGFFDSFAIIHQTTLGGPETATTTLVYKVFKDGFLGMDQGGSAAQSIVLIIVVSVLTAVQFKLGDKRLSYY